MSTKSIKDWVLLDCTPREAYEAWMDSAAHGKMIDGNATISTRVGGVFTIWDGAITGKTLERDPDKHKIVQSWRYDYDDWSEDQPSTLTIEFVPYQKNKCKLILFQSGISANYVDEIAQGWKEYYWVPMKHYFKKR